MTTYTVVWHQQALHELAELWASADRRQAVTECDGGCRRVRRLSYVHL